MKRKGETKKGDLTIKLSINDKLDFVMSNVKVFDVFSRDKVRLMIEYIQEDELNRLLEDIGHEKDNRNRDIDIIKAEHDAINYSLYASEISMQNFMEEFEGYIDVVNGYKELDEFTNKAKNRTVTIN